MSVIRLLSLNAQHVVLAALRRHLEKFPDSPYLPPLIERIEAPFPVIFLAETLEDSKLLLEGMGDMIDVIADFPGLERKRDTARKVRPITVHEWQEANLYICSYCFSVRANPIIHYCPVCKCERELLPLAINFATRQFVIPDRSGD